MKWKNIPSGGSWSLTVATFFGVGLLPRGPATAGSFIAGLIIFVFHPALWLQCIMLAMAIIFGIPAASRMMLATGEDDPQLVVIDEVAGVWTALPGIAITPASVIIGTVLFRVLDKWKVGPVKTIDSWHSPAAVILDDVATGVLVNIVLRVGMSIYA